MGGGVLALVAISAAAAWPDGSPLVPANGGHPGGDPAWAWLYLACEIAAFGLYVVALVLIRRGGLRLRSAAILAVSIQLAPLVAPLLISTDAWTYWDFGRIAAVHDANPYVSTPADFPDDPAFPYVGEDWRDSTTVYGPAFTLASEPLAIVAGSSANAAAWIYKALGAGFLLAAAGLAARLARRKAFALAFVAWNPLLALTFAGGGHNDAWMAALVLAAVALAAAGRRQAPGVVWAVAVLIKWVPLFLLPLRALEARALGRPVGHRGFAFATLAVCAAATAAYGWHWLESFGFLARNANHETSYSIPHRLESLGLPHPGGIVLLALVFGLGYLWLLREAARGRARLGLAMGLLLLATPWLVPWYIVWAVPLAAVEDDPAAQVLALALTAYLLPQAVPV